MNNLPEPTANLSACNQKLLQEWEPPVADWVRKQMALSDAGHGIDHIMRVVENAKVIAAAHCESNVFVVTLAAWLHDCVSVPKDSPLRSQASRLAAEAAEGFLNSIRFPRSWIAAITHCIEAHSFSANVPCETLEAKIVQDADRLEALGAIGIARCLMTGGALQMRLYNPDEPFPFHRAVDDRAQSIDHFFAKLLRLSTTINTEKGRSIARERTEFLKVFLRQLATEIGVPVEQVQASIDKVSIQATD